MPILEPNIYGLWAGKQTAKGTPLATPTRRLVWVGAGDFGFARDDGSETYSDLGKYGAQADWVNSLLGQGEPGIQATPTELAWLLWAFHGAETVTSVAGPPTAQKHTFVPSTGRGHWRHVLAPARPQRPPASPHERLPRHAHPDRGQHRQQGRPRHPARVQPRPVRGRRADPVVALPTDKVLLYTDGTGTFTVDGIVYPAHSQFTFVADEDMSPVFGDDVVPHELVQGTPTVTHRRHAPVRRARPRPVQHARLRLGDADGRHQAAQDHPRRSAPIRSTSSSATAPARSTAASSRSPSRRSVGRSPTRRRRRRAAAPSRSASPDRSGPARSPLYTIDVNTDNAVVAFTA